MYLKNVTIWGRNPKNFLLAPLAALFYTPFSKLWHFQYINFVTDLQPAPTIPRPPTFRTKSTPLSRDHKVQAIKIMKKKLKQNAGRWEVRGGSPVEVQWAVRWVGEDDANDGKDLWNRNNNIHSQLPEV